MDNAQQIHEVEISIETARKQIEFGKTIRRLFDNPDFKTVVLEGYRRDEAERLTLLTAERNITEVQRENTHASLRAIGEFFLYLRTQEAISAQMVIDLEAQEETLQDLHTEEEG